MEDTIIHYGVLGMKWGVRKKPQNPQKTPQIEELSDETLKKYIDRKKLEREFEDLHKKPPKKSVVNKTNEYLKTISTATASVVVLASNANKIKKLIDSVWQR